MRVLQYTDVFFHVRVLVEAPKPHQAEYDCRSSGGATGKRCGFRLGVGQSLERGLGASYGIYCGNDCIGLTIKGFYDYACARVCHSATLLPILHYDEAGRLQLKIRLIP